MMESFSHYLIVGGSAAGMAAAHAIRAIDKKKQITVLSEEVDMPYFRPLIPYLVSEKKSAQDMAINGFGPYAAKDIDISLNSRVTGVDVSGKKVSVENGNEITYEKILFATGSRPYIPEDIEGLSSEGVYALRTLEDARNMAARAKETRHAVMLGGGLLNLKAAFALLEIGIKVTLVVYSPEVLSQLMEPSDAFLIRKALTDAGLEIKTGVAATHVISKNGSVEGILLNNGEELSCQMICIGKGVRPNVEFLAGSGISVDGGIISDACTGASAPDTFTAGDVAVTFDPVTNAKMMTALWTNAVEMGRCAGQNMAGCKTAYTGTFGILNATQVADLPFVSMGTVHTDRGNAEIHQFESGDCYRKIIFDASGEHLIGAVFVGDIKNAGLYRNVIRQQMPVKAIKSEIIGHTLHYGHFM